MSIEELLREVHELPRSEKFRLVQTLISELASEEGISRTEYAIWSPYEAHAAAGTLLRLLAEEKAEAV